RAGRLRAGRRLHTRYGRRRARRPAHEDRAGLLLGGLRPLRRGGPGSGSGPAV
ncbi:uncharacterized protein METZ01_LOCUS345468, partial [marine metagenome]